MPHDNSGNKNPFFGKHHTEETKEKIRNMRLGTHASEQTRKKLSLVSTGRVKSEETRKKLSITHKGIPKSEEHKRKLSVAHIGLRPSEETRMKMRINHKDNSGEKNPMFGTHLSEEMKKKLSDSLKGNKFTLGHHLTEEHKQKIRLSCLGKNTGKRPPFSEEWRKKLGDSNRGKHIQFTDEWKSNLSLSRKKSPKVKDHLHKIMKKVSRISKPQKELYFLLKQILPEAVLEYPIQTMKTWRFADIGVPSLKISFEYDGKHWHENRLEQDKQRDKELAEVGWATFRINNESLKILSKQKPFVLLGGSGT